MRKLHLANTLQPLELGTQAHRALDWVWEHSPTGTIWRQMLLTRSQFARHPLYRYWNHRAFRTRYATLADLIPDHIAQILPIVVMLTPFVGIFITVIFGTGVFRAFLLTVVFVLLSLVLVLAAVVPLLTAAVAALSLMLEHRAGRWDLLMLIPHERPAVLVMRLSSMLYPYRPLTSTADVLQSLAAISAAVVVNAAAANTDDTLLAACFFFILPSLFLLTWERRQDYALSVAIGGMAGVSRQNALGFALGGAALMLATRLMFALLIFSVAGRPSHSFNTIIPLFVGGPAMMPMLGFGLDSAVLLLALYYGLRELLIAALWKTAQEQLNQ